MVLELVRRSRLEVTKAHNMLFGYSEGNKQPTTSVSSVWKNENIQTDLRKTGSKFRLHFKWLSVWSM